MIQKPVLSQEEIEQLTGLFGHPGWEVKNKITAQLIEGCRQGLENTVNDHRYWQGMLAGLRTWQTMIEQVLIGSPAITPKK